MSQMIRKQIYIIRELDQYINVLAQKQDKPEAAVIRDLLQQGMRRRGPLSTGEALRGLAALGERLGMSGPTDLSERHDDYLYGESD
jgi:3-methyladenine DNA glycosylase Mpg